MKIRLQPTNRARQKLLLAYGLLGLTFFLTARFAVNLLSWLPPCPFRTLTGIPCPICGATRAGTYVAQFRWSRAFYENPLFFIFYVAFLFWGLNSLISLLVHKRLSMELNKKEIKLAYKLLFLMLLLNWMYLLMQTF